MTPDAGRCSEWARAAQVDPVGTAGSYNGFLVIEWPLPWPQDIAEVPQLASIVTACADAGVRLQGVVPQPSVAKARRAILYRKPDTSWFGSYGRCERLVPAGKLVDAALELVLSGIGDTTDPATVDDVLVCSHGRRDVCCGSEGTLLAGHLRSDSALETDTVRLWRTTHTGGHRFAPTAIVLPQGTLWAFLDAAAVQQIVSREGPLDHLLRRYRGCAGVGPAPVQALEREAFSQIGWDWLDWQRRGTVGGDHVRLEARSPMGERETWTARVESGRHLPVPVCRQDIGIAEKFETEVCVREVTRATL